MPNIFFLILFPMIPSRYLPNTHQISQDTNINLIKKIVFIFTLGNPFLVGGAPVP